MGLEVALLEHLAVLQPVQSPRRRRRGRRVGWRRGRRGRRRGRVILAVGRAAVKLGLGVAKVRIERFTIHAETADPLEVESRSHRAGEGSTVHRALRHLLVREAAAARNRLGTAVFPPPQVHLRGLSIVREVVDPHLTVCIDADSARDVVFDLAEIAGERRALS